MRKLKVFTDGACKNVKNKDKAIGGWAYVITSENFKIETKALGKLRNGRQNSARAELEALYQALLKMKTYKSNVKFDIYCDCVSVVENIKGTAERKANRDLWEKIEPLCLKLAGRFRIHSVKSHQNNPNATKEEEMNNVADKLAQIGANSLLLAPINN